MSNLSVHNVLTKECLLIPSNATHVIKNVNLVKLMVITHARVVLRNTTSTITRLVHLAKIQEGGLISHYTAKIAISLAELVRVVVKLSA